MNILCKIIFIFMSLILNRQDLRSQSELKLVGPYIGQNVPGVVPQIFAPGFISTDAHEFGGRFSADGK